MDQWKQQIEVGNRYFDSKDYAQAAEHYLLALVRARTLFTDWCNPDEAVAAVVISHLNMADLERAQKRPLLAERELRDLDAYLSLALELNQGSDRDVAIMRGVRRCHMAILEHVKEFSPDSDQVSKAGPVQDYEQQTQWPFFN